MIKQIRNRRVIIGGVMLAVIILVFSALLFNTQIINAEKYSVSRSNSASSRSKVEASRGEILDCRGKLLVTNRQGNSIVFLYSGFPSYKNQAARNELVLRLIELFESAGEEWLDSLPLVFDENGVPSFKEDEEARISFMKSKDLLKLNDYATAQNCFDALVEKFELSEYPLEAQRKLASVFFSMRYLVFSDITPYTFAQDVSTELVARIKENSDAFPGVDVEAVNYRDYPDPEIASHVLGVVGAISEDEYNTRKEKLDEQLTAQALTDEEEAVLKNNAYSLDDICGKSGVEQAMEDYLRGRNGILLTTVSGDGAVTENYVIEPEQGNTVITTIDAGLQAQAQKSLEEVLESQREVSSLDVAGTIIAMDVNTGAIKACVSYPSYNLETYYDDYSDLISDSRAPLWNRAMLSTYAPGSSFKPAMAIAGLESGLLTPSTTYYCSSHFEYLGTTFSCLGSHGGLNIEQSLRYSCNVFYYNTGKNLGIEKMNHYSALLGLGQETGVELPEAKGVLAGPAYREAAGGVWYAGDTVQAAIGQSDNLFTPLQLVNYCATIANGGTRYVPHIIDSVYSADMSRLIYKTQPEVAVDTGFSQDNLDVVKSGMRLVVTVGGCSSYFTDCVVEACAKTGTSQVYKTTKSGASVKANNGFLISFAPYDDPELAIVLACENVGGGSAISRVACDVFNYYFTSRESYSESESHNALIP